MFNLGEFMFPKGLAGNQIDVIVRQDIWKESLDYRHGSGHGVGHVLSVHEFPPNIRLNTTGNGSETTPILPGHIFSDEPGIYHEGKYGIRCENLLLCVKDDENEFGQFLRFETLTLCPFDRKLIDKDYLDEKALNALNSYHKRVYETLSPYLNKDEKKFLKEKTKPL